MNEIKGQRSGVNCHKQEARRKHWLWGDVLGLPALAVILGVTAQGPATSFGQVGSLAGVGEGETVPATLTPPDAATQAQVSEAYGKLPLHFEANHGQTDARVRFVARGPGYTLFLVPTEAVLGLRPPQEMPLRGSTTPAASKDRISKPTLPVLRLQFVGANPRPQVVGREGLSGKSHYFVGNDPRKWHTNIPTYAKVQYRDLYPGIDLVFYGTQRQLEYDIIVAPGADPRAIRLGFDGVDNLEIDAQGDLILWTGGRELRQRKPFIYQEVNGIKQVIPGLYMLTGKSEVGFQVAAYDPTESLIIDPVLTYSTYLGGSDYDAGRGIAVDAAGNAYVTGETLSTNFPMANPFRGTFAGGDAFVTKLNAAGSALIYSTYLGGSDDDASHGIAVDAAGNAYVTGSTRSGNFPTVTPFQGTYGGGSDTFVTKLNAAGSALIYSTYLGGSDYDFGHGIAVDAAGNAYVTGWTHSNNFPMANPFRGTFAGGDAFVTKLNAAGSALIYSTYLGGTRDDFGHGIAVDAAGNAYVTGSTRSGNFPTVTPFQGTYGGGSDAFVTKLNAAGSALIYSTYLGGSDLEAGHGIALDAAGNAYVTGWTRSGNFPTVTPFQRAYGGGIMDAFVVKLNAAGSALIYSTYLGGSGTEFGYGIAVDAAGNAYVTGETESDDFPTANALQPAFGGTGDLYVAKLNPAGSALIYSTYLGGSGYDASHDIALDAAGNAYVTGWTSSANFPKVNPFQGTFAGDSDAFVSKISERPPSPSP